MNLNQLAKDIFETAKAKGWYDEPKHAAVKHMLMVTEIAEATEEARKGTPPVYFETEHGMVTMFDLGGEMSMSVGHMLCKPEGELIELADVVIRILDYCGSKDWDLERAIKAKHAYNQTREHKHGGKKF